MTTDGIRYGTSQLSRQRMSASSYVNCDLRTGNDELVHAIFRYGQDDCAARRACCNYVLNSALVVANAYFLYYRLDYVYLTFVPILLSCV